MSEQDPSQRDYSWEEISNLNHKTQVELFGWCICEDTDGEGHLHEDCPRPEPYCGDCLVPITECNHKGAN